MDYSLMKDDEILRDLAEKMDVLRIEKRMKDSDLESAGGISRQLISNFRNGKRSISLKSFIRILRGLGELDRLESLFAETRQYSPLAESVKKQPRRVRDNGNREEDFKWGDDM
ncbi:helix-turn-helix transcriptional regulator [Oceanispirochaeta sp.]|uniref:helix-turn-helix domain-containing protein n=1 Tax=Oceanispirochaeta sp. TaxID=2035350 RepID=UPI0026110E23|nr:helix-turn-helix transcriptional regulator [Oceanispirochaeta sp.]MDA3955341.1 helix-turn-helix transcriptional regulator [Oceanispirochaeta sp.]